MRDPLCESYEAVPYRHGAIPDSQPARLAAIGRLHGVPAAAPDACRVLELGCAEGMNLLPWAERFPESQFVGVDWSPTMIREGEAARRECGLENAELLCADLRDYEPPPGHFDYIIAHGVLSWVPDEVKQRLFAICARGLAPAGIAYVSYNTLPGWGLLGGLRRFLLEQVDRTQPPPAQLEEARRIAASLGAAMAGQPGAYGELIRQALADMLQKPPALFYHDELSLVNDPCTFTHFLSEASARDLHYLAEAHYASMPWEHVPEAMRAALPGVGDDFLRAQQYMDVMFQRWLRNSLLCRMPPARVPSAGAIRECAVGLRLRLSAGPADLRDGAPLRLTRGQDFAVEIAAPAEKAFLTGLAQAGAARVPFPQAVALANEMLRQAGLPPADEEALCALLLRLFSLDGLDLLLAGDGAWLKTGATAAPSRLMQWEARHDRPVTNRWHEPVSLTPAGRRWLAEYAGEANPGAAQAGLLV